MTQEDLKPTTPRRGFLGKLATGAAALGLAAIASPFKLQAQDKKPAPQPQPVPRPAMTPADEWFSKIKGRHRIVFDSTVPKEIMPFAWPRVFLITNDKTGTPESECGVVVVLRHDAIPFAMDSKLWEKYKFGEYFKVDDPATKTASVRNPFWQPKPGDFKIPGFGEVQIGINELQASGVMFCVCDAAMTVHSAIVADKMKKDAAELKKEWIGGVLPGIMVVPSGVWAVGRAQERGCRYCFAG